MAKRLALTPEERAAHERELARKRKQGERERRREHLLHGDAADGTVQLHGGPDGDRVGVGHLAGDGFSVAGNMLAGPQVISATAEAYLAHAALPFAERLLRALAAIRASPGRLGCLQGQLNIYNSNANWLTRGIMAQTPLASRLAAFTVGVAA